MDLAQTPHRISRSWAGRSIVDHDQGPQNIIHNTNETRLHYTIASVGAHRNHINDRQMIQEWLPCNNCCKWRRIDADTAISYGSGQFLRDAREQRRRELRNYAPSFSTYIVQQLHVMLHEHTASDNCEAPYIITFANFEEICGTALSETVRELCSAT